MVLQLGFIACYIGAFMIRARIRWAPSCRYRQKDDLSHPGRYPAGKGIVGEWVAPGFPICNDTAVFARQDPVD
jgi:hypothetical protein